MFVAERVALLQGKSHDRPALPADADIPRVTYSSPQVASVGLTAEQAGDGAQVADYHLTGNGRALLLLASNKAGSYITGATYLVDGGHTLQIAGV